MVAGGLHHHHGDDAVNVRITWVGGGVTHCHFLSKPGISGLVTL